jgi:hypothetical protein
MIILWVTWADVALGTLDVAYLRRWALFSNPGDGPPTASSVMTVLGVGNDYAHDYLRSYLISRGSGRHRRLCS